RTFFQCVYINAVLDDGNAAADSFGAKFDVVHFAWQQRHFSHPHDSGVEFFSYDRHVVAVHNHVTTADVDFIFHGQCDGHTGKCGLQLLVIGDNGFDPALFLRRQYDDFIALVHNTGGDGAAETAEVQVRAVDVLHRVSEIAEVAAVANLYIFQQ